jgi:hypothetical protein
LQAALRLGRVAILTIDADAFDESLRNLADIPQGALIISLPRDSHFVSAILDGDLELGTARAEAEWVNLALDWQRRQPDIGLWLFECANMPPYAAAVERATGLPVYHTLTLGRELIATTSAAISG